jgi:hypothetical protein
MLKLFILLALTILISLPAITAYCEGSRVASITVSATIPQHVMESNALGITPTVNNPNQLVQTKTVVINNKSFIITSIVLP